METRHVASAGPRSPLHRVSRQKRGPGASKEILSSSIWKTAQTTCWDGESCTTQTYGISDAHNLLVSSRQAAKRQFFTRNPFFSSRRPAGALLAHRQKYHMLLELLPKHGAFNSHSPVCKCLGTANADLSTQIFLLLSRKKAHEV